MHSEYLRTFAEIQIHLEMEEERLKTLDSFNVAFVAKETRSKGNKNNQGRHYKRFSYPPQKGKPKGGVLRRS